MFKLWYVIDYREATGYEFRAPKFICKLYCKYTKRPFLDYAPTEEGY